MSTLRSSLRLLAGGTFSSLAIRDHRLLLFGNMGFQTSIWMQQVVVGWLLLSLGNSPSWLGLGGLATGLAMVIASPFSGVLADAVERRLVLLATQLVALAVNAALALLLWSGRLEIWHLLVSAFAMGLCFSTNMPARQALTAELVGPRLIHNAIALHGVSLNITRISGPALAGWLLSIIGELPVLLLNLVANCGTALSLLTLRYRPRPDARRSALRPSAVIEGFAYCWRQRAIRNLLLAMAAVNFFGLAYVQLLPSLVRDELHGGADVLGLLSSAMGGGALAGTLLLARFNAIGRKQRALGLAALMLGLLAALLGQAESVAQSTVLLVLIGASSACLFPLALGAIQEQVPDSLTGRVLAVFMLTMALMPLGSFPAGAIAAAIGTGPAISIFGSICALSAATIVTLDSVDHARSLKRTDRPTDRALSGAVQTLPSSSQLEAKS